MSQLDGKFLKDSSIPTGKLSTAAKNEVLAPISNKLIALRTALINKTVNGGSNYVQVTTEVNAGSITPTPISNLLSKGVYTGILAGNARDGKRVLIRIGGSDNGIDDGSGDDVYGQMTHDGTHFNIFFYKADGNAYTTTQLLYLDFYYVEVYDELTKPTDAHLISQGIGGVIDASTADAVAAISSKIGTLAATPTNYTPSDSSKIASHLAGIDAALATAGEKSFSDSEFELYDNADANRKLGFEVSAVTSGQKRIVSIPDRNINLDNVRNEKIDSFTLNATDISNQFVVASVSADIKNVQLFAGGVIQEETLDFSIVVNGSYMNKISWAALGLSSLLQAGDKLIVRYNY